MGVGKGGLCKQVVILKKVDIAAGLDCMWKKLPKFSEVIITHCYFFAYFDDISKIFYEDFLFKMSSCSLELTLPEPAGGIIELRDMLRCSAFRLLFNVVKIKCFFHEVW